MRNDPKKVPRGTKRSNHWPTVRKHFLDGKSCAVCGGTKKLEVHHKVPFHLDQALELDPRNLIVLCEGAHDVNCHLFIGHLGNFKGFNPDVESDSKMFARKLAENKARLKKK